MNDTDIAYWGTIAQIAAVLALAIVIEARVMRSREYLGTLSKVIDTVYIAVTALAVITALAMSLQVLRTGSAAAWAAPVAAVVVSLGIGTVVTLPLFHALSDFWQKPKSGNRNRKR